MTFAYRYLIINLGRFLQKGTADHLLTTRQQFVAEVRIASITKGGKEQVIPKGVDQSSLLKKPSEARESERVRARIRVCQALREVRHWRDEEIWSPGGGQTRSDEETVST